MLFPLADYWWFYLGFTALIIVLLAVDLGVFHRKSHTITIREAARWSVVWISLSLLFNVAFYFYAQHALSSDPRLLQENPAFDPMAAARRVALEFLAGYVVEYTLSVDNMFVFVVIFTFFRVPSHLQHRVLFYGILGALVFRGTFIALGSILLSYHWIVVIFGVMLIYTGIKMLGHDPADTDPSKNPLVRLTHRLLPVTDEYHGKHFFIRLNNQLHATPLFLTLVAIEVSDIVFAIDSVPAIFALTKEPLIVYTSNVFAILGLRSLYLRACGHGGAVLAVEVRTGGRAGVHRSQDDLAEPVVRRPLSDRVVAGHHREPRRRLDCRLADCRPPEDIEFPVAKLTPAAGAPGIREVVIARRGADADRPPRDYVAVEEPMEVRVNGASFAVIMRTPGADRDLAAGFLLAEDVIRGADEIGTIECRARRSQTRGATIRSTSPWSAMRWRG